MEVEALAASFLEWVGAFFFLPLASQLSGREGARKRNERLTPLDRRFGLSGAVVSRSTRSNDCRSGVPRSLSWLMVSSSRSSWPGYPEWFAPVRAEGSDNWVPRFNNLKKLSKLITRYYEEGLGKSLDGVEAPNLTAVAKGENDKETLKLCQLVLALAVQCPSNQDQIAKIQSLRKESQHGIMNLIERVMQQLAGDDVQGAPYVN
ncbi:MAG: hypothetical protein BJ554DRAFT_2443 [Olpidium bornovanus]|uniref:HOOK N-terminal domain-containing protein n=1 Tax=Olpidium bornovanus TaxID=278681 RepID=A0A8H7ZQV2_9FUNG|nr:MAG: hypothetical protein BJ554DRAFT_2443 [Olpidium bornovanus]